MKKIQYPNGNPLWNGETLYFSDGKIAWHQNMGSYSTGQVASEGFKGCWKNGNVAWDEVKGYDEEGLFMTNYGVALRLSRMLTLLISAKGVEIDINSVKVRFTILERQ